LGHGLVDDLLSRKKLEERSLGLKMEELGVYGLEKRKSLIL
jgi:hypothetical protein